MDEQDYYTSADIIDAPDIVEEDLVIPEWGGKKVRLRSLTKEDQFYVREEATKRAGEDPSNEVLRGWVERYLILVSVIKPKFTEEQLPQLMKKRALPVERILLKINDMTGITGLAVTSEAAVKEAVKSPE